MRASKATDTQLPESIEVSQNQRAAFYQEQLGLSDQQRRDFMRLNMEFNVRARNLTNRMNALRFQMVDELALPSPEQKKLEKISRDIGDLHYQLKLETVDYYTEMKNVCDDSQQARLYELFRVMADPGGDIMSIPNRPANQGDMRTRRGIRQENINNNRNN